jgi:hypothetical protein
MIERAQFEFLRSKHGSYASWAVWAGEATTSKSNMGDMSAFDLNENPTLLRLLKPDVVMVALNFSRSERNTAPFGNFHDPSPWAQDFKIRYAFRDTPYYGAYMTDIIKNLVLLDSKEVVVHLRKHPEVLAANLELFRQELRDLGTQAPVILAFGKTVYTILKKHLQPGEYSHLVKLTHYSHQISKEEYKEHVAGSISRAMLAPTAVTAVV